MARSRANNGPRSGATSPPWQNSPGAATPCGEPVTGPVDVMIVGAGIAGLSIAYHLLGAGRSVVVIDHGDVAAGETGRSTAHVSNALDDRYTFLAQAHGRDGARLAAMSHRAAIESIAAIVDAEQIACNFERLDGYLFAEDEHGVAELERERDAARDAGLDVELVAHAPALFPTRAALRFANQAQFDPRAYTLGLAAAVVRRGGHLLTRRTITSMEQKGSAAATLDTGEVLHADALVVATNAPIYDNVSLHTKQAPYRSYVIGIEVAQQELTRGLYWDLAEPYHYLRWLDRKVLLVGGEDHRVGAEPHPRRRFDALESWARSRLSSAGAVRFRWSGQVLEPADGLAFIGRSTWATGSSYVVTGDSGNGITHGALAGLLITDLIVGRENPWAKLYDPHRSVVHGSAGLSDFARENAKVALSYADWVVPGRAGDVALAPGEGCVVQRGVHKLAVAVDDAGVRHVCSAVCPHLYAVVRWNALEKSWDCPAHGSRFAPDGAPLNGPASCGLAAATEQDG